MSKVCVFAVKLTGDQALVPTLLLRPFYQRPNRRMIHDQLVALRVEEVVRSCKVERLILMRYRCGVLKNGRGP